MNLRNIRLEDVDLIWREFIQTDLENSLTRRVKITSVETAESNLRNIDLKEIAAKEV